MERLTYEAFGRARSYLLERARPLERELFRVHFEGGSTGAALKALEAFRNDDGGFGRGLEPDYRAENSSVLATCAALGRIGELDLPLDHPFVRGALSYLMNAYEAEGQRWAIIPSTGDGEPHAPWWNIVDLEETFTGFRINPLADVLACLWRFGRAEERRLARALLPVLHSRVERAEDLGPSEVEALLHLWQSPLDEKGARTFLAEYLRRWLPSVVERNPDSWASYCLKPLWAVPDPQCPGAIELADVLEQALDHEIRTQAEDGAWDPFWSWGDAFPDHWPVAREEWRGWLTLRNLRTLRAFGRLS